MSIKGVRKDTSVQDKNHSPRRGGGVIDDLRFNTAKLFIVLSEKIIPPSQPQQEAPALGVEKNLDAIKHWFPLLPENFVAYIEEKSLSHLSLEAVYEYVNDSNKVDYTPQEAHTRDIIEGESVIIRIQQVIQDGRYLSPHNARIEKILSDVCAASAISETDTAQILEIFENILTVADIFILGPRKFEAILQQVPQQHRSLIALTLNQQSDFLRYLAFPRQSTHTRTEEVVAVVPPETRIIHNHYTGKGVSYLTIAVLTTALGILAHTREWIDRGAISRDMDMIKAFIVYILENDDTNMHDVPQQDSSSDNVSQEEAEISQ